MPSSQASEAYAASLIGTALDTFNALPLAEQECIDNALNMLEWSPRPADSRPVSTAEAVLRCGYWIIFERHDRDRRLEIWALLRA